MSPPPGLLSFSRPERAILECSRTPIEVQRYLRSLQYNLHGRTLRSFRRVVADKTANCLEAALAAATILEQHGYPPLLLDLVSVNGIDHVLFLFRQRERWGALGRSRDDGLHGRKPVFRSVRDLVYSYVDPYVDGSARLKAYGVANLDSLVSVDWRFSEKNVWAVERALFRMPHKKLNVSKERHKRMLGRLNNFRAAHPGRPFTGYANSETWI